MKLSYEVYHAKEAWGLAHFCSRNKNQTKMKTKYKLKQSKTSQK